MRGMSVIGGLAIIGMIGGVFLATPEAHAKTHPLTELDLEPSLRSAALVIAVRVDDVSPVHVVYGGKGTQTIFQYTFTPIRVLKGVYWRPELLMTSADLQSNTYNFDPGDIERGQQRLLLLGRSSVGYYGMHSGSTAEQSFPLVSGPADPLLSASKALLTRQELHDRLEIVSSLSRNLLQAEGRGAVVLLAALDRRSDVAAQHDAAFRAVAGKLAADDALVREAAAYVLAGLFQADYLINQAARESAVIALTAALEKPEPQLTARVAALQALASATDAVRAHTAAMRLVEPDRPYDTLAELAARVDVFGRLHEDQRGSGADATAEVLSETPLDAPDPLQHALTQAWARIAAAEGADRLLERLQRKKALGLDGVAEIEAFGLILPKAADSWPMQRALLDNDLSSFERVAFVRACNDTPRPELVPELARMLDPRHQHLRRLAADLLMKIDTREAAAALRPHLAEETNLTYKLQLAAFLGRHGFDDGYSYAVEHMSDARYLEAAVAAIAAIDKPGSAEQLLDIYANSHDLGWQQAAVRALGLLGHRAFTDELVGLTRELAHPLAPAALQARADLGDPAVIELLPDALSSRNDAVLVAAARAAATLLPRQREQRAAAAGHIRTMLAALAADPEAALDVRRHALEGLVAGDDRRLDNVLVAMVRDSRLEQTELLNRVRELMRERKVVIR